MAEQREKLTASLALERAAEAFETEAEGHSGSTWEGWEVALTLRIMAELARKVEEIQEQQDQ